MAHSTKPLIPADKDPLSMTIPTADQFLMGGGVTSAKFERINDYVVGTITDEPEVRQQSDFTTGELKVWDDGRPMMQLVVTLQTDQRTDNDDDGLRRVYVKGKSLTDAVRDAVRKAGAKGLEEGGTLKVAYVGDGTPSKRGLNPPKLYMAEYTKPAPGSASANFLGTGGTQQASVTPPWGQAQDAAPPF